jgi:hypothetical protein
MDAFFEGVNTINEWISFEVNYPCKSSQYIIDKVEEFENMLPDIYVQALQLVCDVQSDCTSFSKCARAYGCRSFVLSDISQ